MKKLKIFLIALAVIIVGVGGYVVYEMKFKNYEVADPKVDSILEEEFEVELEDGTKLVIGKGGKVETVASNNASSSTENSTNENKANNSNTGTNAEDEETSDGAKDSANGSTNNSSTEQQERITVATIKNKYNAAFERLKSQTESRLNSLISEAKTEYTTKKNNGEKISYGYFYRKYMGAATSLEQSTTSAVTAVVKIVEADLKANGYNPEHAQSYVENYEKTKESLRSELMKKVLDY